jgi:outer membrane protein
MHRSIAIGFLGLSLIVLGIVRADASSPSGTKIGYVDLQKTLHETDSGRQARRNLEREKRRKQRNLDQKQEELQRFAAELDKQRAVLQPQVLRQREQELQEKYVELQQLFMQLQQDLAQKEAELVNEIFSKAAPVIERIAKREGYAMILEKSQSAVLWANDAIDITAEVNSRLE